MPFSATRALRAHVSILYFGGAFTHWPSFPIYISIGVLQCCLAGRYGLVRGTVAGEPDIAPLRRSSVWFGGAGTGTSAGPPRKQREQFQARSGDNPPGGFEQEVRTDSASDSYLPQNSCTGLTGCAATTIRGCGAHYHFEPDTHSACSISCFQFSSSIYYNNYDIYRYTIVID